jgi:hypothetical protein
MFISMPEPTKDNDETAAAYDTFDEYLRLSIKEYYDRGWKSRRANFIAFLWASGQTVAMAKGAVSGEKGLKNIAVGAAGVVALRLALRWALGGPLGILLTAATGASLIAFAVKNQKDISSKMNAMKKRIDEEKTKFEEIQGGYRGNRYDARERNLMVEGQLKRFLNDIDQI